MGVPDLQKDEIPPVPERTATRGRSRSATIQRRLNILHFQSL
jgi:hypothetical protein